MWCIGKLTPEYRARMYDVIDLYHRPYNPEEPVICVDEKSKQLLAETRPAIALKPGSPLKQDYEYARHGTRNLFVAVEPLAGWRQVQVTAQRRKPDFVRFIRRLLQGRYRLAKVLHIVLDNLNTHFAKCFVDVLGENRAAKLLSRIEFHYTPHHGSWLNMAEIEIGILDKQCLDRRIPTAAEMVAEVKAWKTKRNRQRKTINWSFTKEKADTKLKKYYIDVA
jgi:DDE superfamily endonuclease